MVFDVKEGKFYRKAVAKLNANGVLADSSKLVSLYVGDQLIVFNGSTKTFSTVPVKSNNGFEFVSNEQSSVLYTGEEVKIFSLAENKFYAMNFNNNSKKANLGKPTLVFKREGMLGYNLRTIFGWFNSKKAIVTATIPDGVNSLTVLETGPDVIKVVAGLSEISLDVLSCQVSSNRVDGSNN